MRLNIFPRFAFRIKNFRTALCWPQLVPADPHNPAELTATVVMPQAQLDQGRVALPGGEGKKVGNSSESPKHGDRESRRCSCRSRDSSAAPSESVGTQIFPGSLWTAS